MDTEPRGVWALGGVPVWGFCLQEDRVAPDILFIPAFVLEAEWMGADVLFCTLRVIKKLTSLTWGELEPPLVDPLPLPHTTGVKRASLPNTSASTSVLRAFVLA